jgi:uncharacterized membrane protein HdeD (DUF308 family)
MNRTASEAGNKASAAAVSEAVAESRFLFIALGVVLVVLGAAAIGAPIITTIAVKGVLGWLFLIAGIAQVIHAFYSSGWKGFLLNLLIGILYAVVGVWLAFLPLTGIIGLTLLLAIMFVAEGVFKFGLGFQVKPLDGWLWVVFSGVASIVVGALIFLGLPTSADWSIGLLVGINLFLSGVTFLVMAITARSGG